MARLCPAQLGKARRGMVVSGGESYGIVGWAGIGRGKARINPQSLHDAARRSKVGPCKPRRVWDLPGVVCNGNMRRVDVWCLGVWYGETRRGLMSIGLV